MAVLTLFLYATRERRGGRYENEKPISSTPAPGRPVLNETGEILGLLW